MIIILHVPVSEHNLLQARVTWAVELTLKPGLSDREAALSTPCNTIHDGGHRDPMEGAREAE